ncbi:MAG: hypothetical protein JXR97_13865 [Planctomycetes bacterium]|nr:hypothetical protein [Planctomycetota bacterium]
MGDDKMNPPMYTDMKETQFIKWNLEYTETYLLETMKSIPDDKFLVPPRDGMEPPAIIFANCIIKEAIHTQGFNQGKIEIPEQFKCLLPWQGAAAEEKIKAVSNREELTKLFKQVRAATYAYLDSLSDGDLKKVPAKSILKDGDPNRGNPVREAFVMSIYTQNVTWGKLIAIKEMLGLPPTEPETWQK